MLVNFGTKALQAAYESQSVATGRWGKEVARKYVLRVNQLYALPNGKALYAVQSFRFHQLKGTRKGEYAIDLNRSWRLVVTFDDQAMTVVSLQEVSNHYGG